MIDKRLIEKHERYIWTRFALIFLGIWLVFTHFAMGYHSQLMGWNDIICGIVLFVLGCASLSVHNSITVWIAAFVGIWLEFAPLAFWAEASAAYLNDTVIGTLVIAVTILIPGMPGVVEEPGSEIPPGWSYNPSSWSQRIPIVLLGFTGWMISRYLAAYQLGYIPSLWDPFFGTETETVVTSNVAHAFPVSDAGLGCFAYTLETLMGLKGGSNRWRTMPWMVIGFGILVVPLGVTSIVLVILQPVIVHAWCTLCLITASAMLIMIVLAMDEVIAVLQFLHQSMKEGKPFWQTFWKGGTPEGARNDNITPPFHSSPFRIFKSMIWGGGLHWSLILQTAIGVWLMFTPHVFGLNGLGADLGHLFGALTIVISVISQSEVIRVLRFTNILFGLYFAISTWFIDPYGSGVHYNYLACGIVLILLSFPKGRIFEKYGTWDRYIR